MSYQWRFTPEDARAALPHAYADVAVTGVPAAAGHAGGQPSAADA